jgi:hypothetical protein
MFGAAGSTIMDVTEMVARCSRSELSRRPMGETPGICPLGVNPRLARRFRPGVAAGSMGAEEGTMMLGVTDFLALFRRIFVSEDPICNRNGAAGMSSVGVRP